MNPAFTVVIPFRNRAAFLERALSSVVVQSVRPLQIVLVDNGSTDESVQVCRTFITANAAESHLTFVLLSEPKPGAARARNLGLQAAVGEWVVFFDSDDEMSPDFLGDVATVVAQNKIDVVAAATRLVFEDGREKQRTVYYTGAVSDQILTGMIATQGIAVRTAWLRQLGGWDAELRVWDDWELGVRILAARPRLVWLRRKAYHRLYQHSDSITGTDFASRHAALLQAFSTVARDLDVCPMRERCISATALACRAALMSGRLLYEKRRDLSVVWQQQWAPVAPLPRLAWLALRCYAALGLPGGWWVCRILLRPFYSEATRNVRMLDL